MVLTLNSPMPRLRLEQQIVGGEDYLNEVSSADAPDVALGSKETSSSGGSLFFPLFLVARQKK